MLISLRTLISPAGAEPAGASGVDTSTRNWAIDGPDADALPDSGFTAYATNVTDVLIDISAFSTAGSNDGLYTAIFTVDDNLGNTGTDSFTFNVDTVAPAVDAGSDITDWGSSVNRTPTVSDASGIASYSWALSGAAAVDPFSTLATLEIDSNDLTADGTYTATLTVLDIAGNPKSDSFTFKYDNDLPIVNAGTSYSGSLSKTGGWTQTSASASDSASGIASTLWTYTGPGTITITDTASIQPIIETCSADGTYEMTLTVIDNAGNENSAAFTFVWDTLAPAGTDLAGADLLGSSAPDAYDDNIGFARTAGTASEAGSE